MRLIDADALIAEMHNVILEDGEDRRIFYEVIERQSTIDAVDVVRCKDCKFKQKCPTKIFGEHSDDWFCADGERRDPCS